MNGNNRLRTIVCGSRFGQFYLEALRALPEHFELVGLLAKGSERSRQCAERYGIPLYTDTDQLPGNHIDVACVVLRSSVMGGSGTDLSLKLLERGIHVIQEHPVHYKDLASCLRTARQHGVHFATGDLYVHVAAVRRFIACARAMLKQQQALYIDAACATQVSYPLMHILQEALSSIRPWSIHHVVQDVGPFQVLSGLLGNVPITVRAHNEVDPDEPDNYLHLLHSLTIGVQGGSLSLVDTHGPVIWRPRLHAPDVHDIPEELRSTSQAIMLESSAQILGPTSAPSYKDILAKEWPKAIGRDLLDVRDVVIGKKSGETRAQRELLCSRQWQDMTQALGYPVLRAHQGHYPLSVETIREAAYRIDAEETAEDAEVEVIDAGQVRACVERLDDAALSSMLYSLQSQGALTVPERAYSEADIFAAASVTPRHQHVVTRWLRILAERSYVKRNGTNFQRTELITKEQVEQRWEAAMEAWSGKLGPSTIIDYLIANAKRLPQLMSGEQQAALLLFPEGRMDIANALYRDTAIAKLLNRMVADEVMRIASKGQELTSAPGSSEAQLRIVELGAGTGATTDVVIHSLKKWNANRPKQDYLYTDISRFFLAAARERYADCPWVRYRLIDIDQSLVAQGLETSKTDIIIAVGVLNNARDTVRVVQGLMQSLAPGGTLLITEPVREFMEMLISQAFMMARTEDDRINSDSTFVSVAQWLDVFRLAGAEDAKVLPDDTHPLTPLGQKLFVVRKPIGC